jgi:hypothetical protein
MQSTSASETHAMRRASVMTSKAHSLWWSAVSRGWNPSPGGVMYVCLIFESATEEPSGQCFITPAPSLFAEPSSPRAKIGRSFNETNYQYSSSMRRFRNQPGFTSGDWMREAAGIARIRKRTSKQIATPCQWKLFQLKIPKINLHISTVDWNIPSVKTVWKIWLQIVMCGRRRGF